MKETSNGFDPMAITDRRRMRHLSISDRLEMLAQHMPRLCIEDFVMWCARSVVDYWIPSEEARAFLLGDLSLGRSVAQQMPQAKGDRSAIECTEFAAYTIYSSHDDLSARCIRCAAHARIVLGNRFGVDQLRKWREIAKEAT